MDVKWAVVLGVQRFVLPAKAEACDTADHCIHVEHSRAPCCRFHVGVPCCLQVNEGLADTPTDKLEYSLRQVRLPFGKTKMQQASTPASAAHACSWTWTAFLWTIVDAVFLPPVPHLRTWSRR